MQLFAFFFFRFRRFLVPPIPVSSIVGTPSPDLQIFPIFTNFQKIPVFRFPTPIHGSRFAKTLMRRYRFRAFCVPPVAGFVDFRYPWLPISNLIIHSYGETHRTGTTRTKFRKAMKKYY